jgi:hypothetical protein
VALRLGHTHKRLRFGGADVYTANLSEGRILYHFSVRAIVQYRLIERNAALYTGPVDERSEKLFTQFLFSYKVTPQTALSLGLGASPRETVALRRRVL